MSDLKRTGLHNQKRGVSVAVADIVDADVQAAGSTLFTLPANVMVTALTVLVITAASAGTVDIAFNGTEIGSEVVVSTVGAIIEVPVPAAAYSATGGDILVDEGAVAITGGTFVGKLIVEYIELNKVTGEYTD